MASQTIHSIENASKILKCMCDGLSRIKDISSSLDLNKATVHKILKTLETVGFAIQDPLTRQYFVGPHYQNLIMNIFAVNKILIQTAFEHMVSLRILSGETVLLQMRKGAERVVLEEVHGDLPLRYYSGKGQSIPVYVGAAGKILLSAFNNSELESFLERIQLFPIGPNTITDKVSLLRECEKIRKKGYAISCSEHFEDAYSIAVPIKNYTCPISLGIVGSESHTKKKKKYLLEHILKTSDTISEKLSNIPGLRNAP
jgi:DNA-binding IclR family transcriptional regulator